MQGSDEKELIALALGEIYYNLDKEEEVSFEMSVLVPIILHDYYDIHDLDHVELVVQPF